MLGGEIDPKLPLILPVPITKGGTGSITAATARTSLGAAASGANGDITSMTGITTTIKAPRSILDTNGNIIFDFQVIAAATDYLQVQNGLSGSPPGIYAVGSTTDINIIMRPQGAGVFYLESTSNQALEMFTGTGYQHLTVWATANTSATRTLTLPDASGTITLGGIVKVATQTFSATGSFTYTPTATMTYVIVKLVGGGGASGGAAATTASLAIGGGGGGGAYAEFILTAAQVGASLAGSVGAGGTVGTAGANPGNNGGNTTLTTASGWTAAGGTGGSGSASSTTGITITGGAGGTVTTGTGTLIANVAGQKGATGFTIGATHTHSGSGGNSGLGQGGIGIISVAAITSTGAAGSGYGAGSGGAANFVTQSAVTGTAGKDGVAIFYEFCS